MLDSESLQAGLAQFSGTETWYRFRFSQAVLGLYTDGVQWLAENAECYWLLTEIFTALLADKDLKEEPFQAWKLIVNADRSALLMCEDGNGNPLFSKDIPYTDFPLETITLWLEDGEPYAVLLLPSEH